MNTSIPTKISTAVLSIMGSAALCLTLATAVKAEDAPTETVRFNDLDLAHAAGAKALYTRIRVAARDVCDSSLSADPILRLAAKACIDKAIDDAVRKVDAPMLTNLRFGNPNVRLASK